MKQNTNGPSRLRWRRAFVFVGVTVTAALALSASVLVVNAKHRSTDALERGLARSQVQKPPANSGAGKQVWAGNCAGCHGLDGRGGERGPNIATNPEIADLTDTEITRIVHDGSPNMAMPALGRTLSDAQIAAVVEHLRALQGDQRASALPGDPKAGQSLYFGKAECSSCHMIAGLGGFLGPDLSDVASMRPAEEIREAILHPQPDPRAKTAVIFTRDDRKYLGIIRNEDNFSVQLQTADGAFHLFDRAEIERVEYQKQSLMPANYATRLSAAELDDIVSFLMATSRAREAGKKGGEHKTWEDKDDE